MVVYDLICSQGHRFEGWFQDLKDLKAQLKNRQLACPVCGDESVSRRPSTFGVVRSGRTEKAPVPAAAPAVSAAGPPEQLIEQFMKSWESFSKQLEKEFDDVGTDFTDEALKMHYGVSAPRNIRGQSTEDQDALLKKEGVTVYKMPVLSRKNSSSSEESN
ncbi:DUF1178 domain-containing protein [Deltaproteobacteria bacterium Smac51]|nr:DUF1178 domain-containing protein [Deltaproteobacteria bacterium Smac51]